MKTGYKASYGLGLVSIVALGLAASCAPIAPDDTTVVVLPDIGESSALDGGLDGYHSPDAGGSDTGLAFDARPDQTIADIAGADALPPDAPIVDLAVPRDMAEMDAMRDARSPDARPPDARPPDAMPPDVGLTDARAVDASALDIGLPDAAPPDQALPDAVVCPPGFEAVDGACLDRDECYAGEHGCHPDRVCQNLPGAFACVCPPGTEAEGDGCAPVETCADVPGACAGGQCVDQPDGWRCVCFCGFRRAETGRACLAHWPRRLYVDADTDLAPARGTCWDNAFPELQTALERVEPGGEIWIAGGTYRPGDGPDDSFVIPPDVTLLGGFRAGELDAEARDPGAPPTVLDGDPLGDDPGDLPRVDPYADDVSHVVSVPEAGGGVVLDRLTIVGGALRDDGGAAIRHGAGHLNLSGVRLRGTQTRDRDRRVEGAAVVSAGELHVVESHFTALERAIESRGGVLAVDRSVFEGVDVFAARGIDAVVDIRRSTFVDSPIELHGSETTLVDVDLRDAVDSSAVSLTGGALQVEDCRFADNHDRLHSGGAGVEALDARLTIIRSHFARHAAEGNPLVTGGGAAVRGVNVDADIADSAFVGQVAGRAVAAFGGRLRIAGSTFEDNAGGALRLEGGVDVRLIDTRFVGNSAGLGGAVALSRARLWGDRLIFEDNTATGWGGAMSSYGGRLTLRRTWWSGNQATRGGALSLENRLGQQGDPGTFPSPIELTQAFFRDNRAGEGGAIRTQERGLALRQVAFVANEADGQGGALWARHQVQIEHGTFTGNVAAEGPAAYLADHWTSGLQIDASVVGGGAEAIADVPDRVRITRTCLGAPWAGAGDDNVIVEAPVAPDGTPAVGCRDQLPALPADDADLDDDGDTAEPWPLDVLHRPRSVGEGADLGAFEAPPDDCVDCGDAPCRWGPVCEPPADACGDGVCGSTEHCRDCPADCGPCGSVCGDGLCAPSASCRDCVADCGPCPVRCGDGICEGPEACADCPDDCGVCGPTCGDARCEGVEDCTLCPDDCGACASGCPDGLCRARCTRDGWCWLDPLPHGNHIRALWGPAGDAEWAVGDAGAITRRVGDAWWAVDGPTAESLLGVTGTADGVLWAVGEAGTILRGDADGWRAVPSPTGRALRGVWGAAPDDVWAVGDRARLRFDGVGWQADDRAFDDLYAISGTGPDDVWAVGTSGGSRTVQQWNGSEWGYHRFRGGTPSVARGVWPTPGGAVHVAGSAGLAWRQDDAWMHTGLDVQYAIFDVHGTAFDDAWAVGDKSVLHFDGLAWDRRVLPDYTVLDAVRAGPDTVWAAGSRGLMMRGGADGFEVVHGFQGRSASSEAIWAAGPDAIFAVGQAMRWWDGLEWREEALPEGMVARAVWGRSPDDVWALGDRSLEHVNGAAEARAGIAVHFDGVRWSAPALLPYAPLHGVWGAPDGPVWAVGEDGVFVLDDGRWRPWVMDSPANLLSIHGRSRDDIWAGGASGQLWHFAGDDWREVRPGTREGDDAIRDFYSITTLDDGTAYAAAYFRLWHYDRAVWREIDPPTDRALIGLWGHAADRVWLLDDHGDIHRFDGARWHRVPTGHGMLTRGLWGSAPDTLWVVGRNGIVEHRSERP